MNARRIAPLDAVILRFPRLPEFCIYNTVYQTYSWVGSFWFIGAYHDAETKMRHRIILAMLAAASLAVTGFMQRPPRWSASIKMVHEDRVNENVDSVRAIGGSSGSASWRSGETPTLSVVDLTFSYGGTERELTWGIFVGRCRSASVPIVPVSSFPEIELTGGTVRVQAQLSLELPHTGQYHLNVYRDRSAEESTLVACGDFKYSARG